MEAKDLERLNSYIDLIDDKEYGLILYCKDDKIHFENRLKPAFQFIGVEILESDQPDSFAVSKDEVYKPNSDNDKDGGRLLIDGRIVFLADTPLGSKLHT